MSTTTTQSGSRTLRSAGLSLVVGSVLLAVALVLDSLTGVFDVGVPGSAEFLSVYGLFALGGLFAFLGLGLAAARVRARLGGLTFVGFLIGAAGYLAVAVGLGMDLLGGNGPTVDSTGGTVFWLGFLVTFVASLVVGLGLLRVGLARAAAVVLVAAPVLLVLAVLFGESVGASVGVVDADLALTVVGIVQAVGWGLLGLDMRRSTGVAAPRGAAPAA